MRYETEEKFKMPRSLHGPAYSFGINDTQPKVVHKFLPKYNTKINVVKSSQNYEVFRTRTSSKVIDYRHKIRKNRLTIKIRIE